LYIDISTDENERTLTIFDSGIGMSKEEVAENLGTIAKSGSREFKNLVENAQNDSDSAESIIGQFGVGFYSSFIVSNDVTVITKKEGEAGVLWRSDGSGEYEIATIDNLDFGRGTQITLKLNPEAI